MNSPVRTPIRPQSFTYPARPEPGWAKVLGGIVIAVIAVVTLAVLGIGWMMWSAFGGVAHNATDKTVTAARTKAKPMDEADVARIVSVLAPTLGQPVSRALADGCMPNDPDNYVSNQIKCERQYDLYYPTAAEPPKASVIAGLLAADAKMNIMSSYEKSGWSSQAMSQYRSGLVEVVARPADAKDGAYTCLGLPWTIAETQGCEDMSTVTASGTYVVVEYSDSYFYG